ncbi:hypothetical protein EYS42_12365 [Aquabacterium lacunae]|uniref:Uncharacterized protein n=1 Tax=Aquabacterium lacunae TaxID=2528630 RepID=A0A4Q9GWT8_9BURK|nr:hypothetical protein [Aquabacterium lacunae]TBO29200.1 hypothetical protein EYS42_12365 [Aquabacterium lacunae]
MLAASLGLLGGCAQVAVERLNSGGPASYALYGPNGDALQAEASRRCAQGHEVHRQADKAAGLTPDWALPRWWNLAMQRLDGDDRRAQLVITCR